MGFGQNNQKQEFAIADFTFSTFEWSKFANATPESFSKKTCCRLYPIASMYSTFTYIYHKNQRNVGKYYQSHGWYGYEQHWKPRFPQSSAGCLCHRLRRYNCCKICSSCCGREAVKFFSNLSDFGKGKWVFP